MKELVWLRMKKIVTDFNNEFEKFRLNFSNRSTVTVLKTRLLKRSFFFCGGRGAHQTIWRGFVVRGLQDQRASALEDRGSATSLRLQSLTSMCLFLCFRRVHSIQHEPGKNHCFTCSLNVLKTRENSRISVTDCLVSYTKTSRATFVNM